jgi:hypothetical protein
VCVCACACACACVRVRVRVCVCVLCRWGRQRLSFERTAQGRYCLQPPVEILAVLQVHCFDQIMVKGPFI